MSQLEQAVTYSRLVKNSNVINGILKLNLESSSEIELLDELNDSGNVLSIKRNGVEILLSEAKKGGVISIDFRIPRISNSFFAKDFDDLFSSEKSSLFEEPENFYIHELGFLASENADFPIKLLQYRKMLEAVNFLTRISDYDLIKDSTKRLIFFEREKLDIPISYTTENFSSLWDVDVFAKDFFDGKYTSHKRSIFVKIITENIGKSEDFDKFAVLIAKISSIIQQYDVEFTTFINEISFDKIKSELESKKMDLIIKINKTITDIQDKFLVIPIANLLSLTQLRQIKSSQDQYINSGILASSLIFALFMFYFIYNQKDTLKIIFLEAEGKLDELKRVHPAMISTYEPMFEEINKRYNRQNIVLFIILLIVLCVTIFTIFYYSILFINQTI